MSVLLLSGKPVNWSKPPKANARVMWSQRTTGGAPVTGSLRTIAHLDHLNTLARKRFGVGIVVIQPPYNTGVAASAGTHDKDACLDVWIPGVPGKVVQAFIRANGGGAFYRCPPTFSDHIHYFCLPPAQGSSVSLRYRLAGLVVGKYVDGGWSLYGKAVGSSQIGDYYAQPPRNALAGHAVDNTWHPANIDRSVFDLDNYVARMKRIQIKASAPKPNPAHVTFWNTKVGDRPGFRADLDSVTKGQDVVGLMETGGHRVDIRAWAKNHDWTVVASHARSTNEDEFSSLILVRPGVKVLDSGFLRIRTKWVGPQGDTHEGRVFPWVRVDINGRMLLVLLTHLPWGYEKNKAAFGDCLAAIEKFASAHDTLDLLIGGDMNQPFSVTTRPSVARVAKRIKALIVRGASRIDYGLFRLNKRGHHRRVVGHKNPKHGSDHFSAEYVITTVK